MDKLVILWTTDNKETALDMVLMYTLKANTNRWWKYCELITWGPSNRLVCEDKEVQEQLKLVQEAGVKITACKRCAERHGLENQLEALGIEIKFMGEPLTQYLKDENCRVISI
jgi:hypothetical protein